MKRYNKVITAASDKDKHPLFADVWTLLHDLGYDVDVDGFDLKVSGGDDYMPDITIYYQTHNDLLYYDFTLKFPELNTEDIGGTNSITYILNQWSKLSRLDKIFEKGLSIEDFQE